MTASKKSLGVKIFGFKARRPGHSIIIQRIHDLVKKSLGVIKKREKKAESATKP